MHPKQLRYLIRRFREGTATAEERELLEMHWKHMLDQEADDGLSESQRSVQKHDVFQNIVSTIQQQEPGSFRRIRPLYRNRWLTVAASLVGIVLIVTASRLWLSRSAPLEYQTAYGERKHIVLPEGSEVWLNGHSKLRYAPDSLGNREVWLDGEAQFSVRHTANHNKFVVHMANRLNVEVLGTVFNVVNRHGDVNVVLRSGAVRVVDETRGTPDVILKPNEMISRSRARPLLAKAAVQAQPRLGWKDGAMYLENKPLGEIFDWIRDTYGIHVQCVPELRDETFAGTIPTDSIDSYFTMIEKLYQVKIRKDGQTYLIE
ncbi:FecR family protein [Dyadobacter crusticola]|uniref:FecR family protein n=1 Tax=Dyadobacter crusticola TaxID=292407 RepID=UPI000A04956F|nr:FecR domain-containing protein [Dyadobacter crusticola]